MAKRTTNLSSDFEEWETMRKRSRVKIAHVKQNSRIFQDSVHGTIKVDPLLAVIIDTPQFQRLRDLKQLGAGYWVYPGACHNRFEHCIGTSYLCGLMLTTLRDLHKTEYENDVEITDKDILCVKIAGLCHDLGHGPFSHTFDGDFIKRVRPNSNWTHEQGSCDLFDYMIETNEGLNEMLMERGIGENERSLIKRMILGRDPEKEVIQEICSYDETTAEKWFLYEIVSNKRTGIDCDKLDYFARDTHHTGMKNTFDFRRYFQNIRILLVDGQLQICVRDKEMFNLYELFHVRWTLHHQVYQHKTVHIIEEMFCQAFLKVDSKFGISSAIDDMESYTNLTDSLVYDILRSKDTDPSVKEAQDILRRVQRRDFSMYFCAQINPESTKREPEELSLSQPVSLQPDVISQEIVDVSGGTITIEDLFIKIISIGYGMKNRNPVEKVVFFTKHGTPTKLRRDHLSEILPCSFLEKHIRVYSTAYDKKQKVEEAFKTWCKEKGYLIPNMLEGGSSGYFTDACKSEVAKTETNMKRISNVIENGHVKRQLIMSNVEQSNRFLIVNNLRQ